MRKKGDKNMKIEHIAMYVNDLEAAKSFFTEYLGGHSNEGYHNRTTDFRSYLQAMHTLRFLSAVKRK